MGRNHQSGCFINLYASLPDRFVRCLFYLGAVRECERDNPRKRGGAPCGRLSPLSLRFSLSRSPFPHSLLSCYALHFVRKGERRGGSGTARPLGCHLRFVRRSILREAANSGVYQIKMGALGQIPPEENARGGSPLGALSQIPPEGNARPLECHRNDTAVNPPEIHPAAHIRPQPAARRAASQQPRKARRRSRSQP